MGSGRYSERLSYKDWYIFNNSQRVHYNFVEQVASIIALIFITALALPQLAGYLGWAYFIGRLAYAVGYAVNGPKGRLVGAIFFDLAMLTLFVTSIVSVTRLYNGTA